MLCVGDLRRDEIQRLSSVDVVVEAVGRSVIITWRRYSSLEDVCGVFVYGNGGRSADFCQNNDPGIQNMQVAVLRRLADSHSMRTQLVPFGCVSLADVYCRATRAK